MTVCWFICGIGKVELRGSQPMSIIEDPTHVSMQKSNPHPEFLFLSTDSRRGTKMGPGRGGLIKNPNKALQPLVAKGRAWAHAFHRPSHQGALTNIPGASACPWLHYPFRREQEVQQGSPMLPDNISKLTTRAPPQHTPPTPDPLMRDGIHAINHLPMGPTGSTYCGQMPAPGSQATLVWNLEQRLIKTQQRGMGFLAPPPEQREPRLVPEVKV